MFTDQESTARQLKVLKAYYRDSNAWFSVWNAGGFWHSSHENNLYPEFIVVWNTKSKTTGMVAVSIMVALTLDMLLLRLSLISQSSISLDYIMFLGCANIVFTGSSLLYLTLITLGL